MRLRRSPARATRTQSGAGWQSAVRGRRARLVVVSVGVLASLIGYVAAVVLGPDFAVMREHAGALVPADAARVTVAWHEGFYPVSAESGTAEFILENGDATSAVTGQLSAHGWQETSRKRLPGGVQITAQRGVLETLVTVYPDGGVSIILQQDVPAARPRAVISACAAALLAMAVASTLLRRRSG